MDRMDEEVKKYFVLVVEAMNRVNKKYFNLATSYEPNGIVRERVFCYELYHQLRCLQENRELTQLSLNGEIDKRGHIIFEEQDRKNPDFVFHIPGQMSGNTIIVEVKGRTDHSYFEKCEEDIETIYVFISKYKYKLGVFILYNYNMQEFKNLFMDELKNNNMLKDEQDLEKIYIICKKDSSSDTETENLRDILEE